MRRPFAEVNKELTARRANFRQIRRRAVPLVLCGVPAFAVQAITFAGPLEPRLSHPLAARRVLNCRATNHSGSRLLDVRPSGGRLCAVRHKKAVA
jgi:hypothetical protein